MSRKTSIPTYFKSLSLKNVRCFKNAFLDLVDESGNIAQWTLLLGDNGVGKTTLLQGLCWMRPAFEENSESENSKENGTASNVKEKPEMNQSDSDLLEPLVSGNLKSFLTSESNEMLETLLRNGNNSEMTLSASLCQGIELNSGKIIKRSQLKNREVKTKIKINYEDRIISEDPEEDKIDIEKELGEFWEPFIVTYGANRWMNLGYTGSSRVEDPLAANLSIKGTQLRDAEQELIVLYTAAEDQRKKRIEEENERLRKSLKEKNSRSTELKPSPKSLEERMLGLFKKTLAKILPNKINASRDIVIDPPRYINGELKNAEVKIKIKGQPVPFSELSLGYQTTMTWVMDLVWQLFENFPESENPLLEPAIVIIDEIDLHLHPHWQWTIMKNLAELFPKTQFIGTSHSPLMVQSMPTANFAIIQEAESEMVIENNPEKIKGWRVDQILNSEYFKVPFSRPPETELLFQERDKLLLKTGRTAKEESRLKHLQEQISALRTETDAADDDAMNLIQQAAELLKKSKLNNEEK